MFFVVYYIFVHVYVFVFRIDLFIIFIDHIIRTRCCYIDSSLCIVVIIVHHILLFINIKLTNSILLFILIIAFFTVIVFVYFIILTFLINTLFLNLCRIKIPLLLFLIIYKHGLRAITKWALHLWNRFITIIITIIISIPLLHYNIFFLILPHTMITHQILTIRTC